MSRKGQMFVVTSIFLVGLIFTVQHILLAYADIDFMQMHKTGEARMMGAVIGTVNDTINKARSCTDFEYDLQELLGMLDTEISREGFIFVPNYELNCSNWDNKPPKNPPLRISLTLLGNYESSGLYDFYHVSETDNEPPRVRDITVTPPSGGDGTLFSISAEVTDLSGVNVGTVNADITKEELVIDTVSMAFAGGDRYGADWDSTGQCGAGSCSYSVRIRACDIPGNCIS